MLPQPQEGSLSKAAPFVRADGREAATYAAMADGPLSPLELDRFRRVLLQTRDKLLDELSHLEAAANEGDGVRSADFSTTSQDGAGRAWAWQRTLVMADADNKRTFLRDVNEALDRLARNQFGQCVVDRHPIPRAKLVEAPWTSLCESCGLHGPTA